MTDTAKWIKRHENRILCGEYSNTSNSNEYRSVDREPRRIDLLAYLGQ